MNLSKKLLLNSLIPMMMILLSGGFAIWQTNRILENFAVESDTYDANVRAALELQVEFKEQVHQWKNVLLRGSTPENMDKHWAAFERAENEIEIKGAALVQKLGDSRGKPIIQHFLVMHRNMGESYRKSLRIFLSSHYNSHLADVPIRGIDQKASEVLEQAADVISEDSNTFDKKTMADAWDTAILSSAEMLLILLATLYLFHRSLNKNVLAPIGLLSSFARKFGTGDHSLRINFKSDDEIGTLTEAFNQASEKLESLVANLEESNTRYSNLLQGIDAIIWELNTKTNRYTFVSRRAEEMLGYPLSAWFDEPGFLEKYCHPDDLAASQEKILTTLAGGTSGEFTCRAITANGNIVWLNNRIRAISNARGAKTALLGIMVDITRMKQYEDRMAYLTSHDELTGLANRNLLVDRLDRAIAHARGAGNMTALMLVNLDRFKLINESLGTQAGDKVLQAAAQRLQKVISTDDTLAHLGGDEFAIVLRDVSKPEHIAEIARKVLHFVSLTLEIDGHPLNPSCSVGISVAPKDGNDSRTMLKNAGSALTRVKQVGRNNFKFYTEEMNAKALFSLQLENKMRSALESGEFALYYQPQIDISDNRMIGVEALIRWIPPGKPMISPLDFIPLAEETGLILPIGEWVIREACRQNKAWQRTGLAPFCVAVNLSSRQFAQPGLVKFIARALDETGLDPQYLELEITESVMMHDIEFVIKTLHELNALGVKLAIDDFGTGYSSLSYLKRFPIDKLKIDKSFVQDIDHDPDDEAIVSAIIAMAHSLKIKVIAEGVETEAQLQYLHHRKCDEVQGYFYSKPVEAGLLESFAALRK